MPDSTMDRVQSEIPEAVARVGEAMASYTGEWSLCGGWAVDAWLGAVTREHGDVDIVVFQDELPLLFEHLRGWQLVAHDSEFVSGAHPTEAWGGSPLSLPAHIHGCPPELVRMPLERLPGVLTLELGFWLDIQVNERAGGQCVLSRDPRVGLPPGRYIRQSPWGLPTVVPEALLFHKASEIRGRDQQDFVALSSTLTEEQRQWLREALSLLGHPWLTRL